MHQPIRTQENRSHGKFRIPLLQSGYILTGEISLSDRPRTQIQDLVATIGDLVEKVSHAIVTPIVAKPRQDMPKHIRFGNGAIDVRNNNFGGIVPQEHFAFDSRYTLKLTLHRELDRIGSRLQVHLEELIRRWSQSSQRIVFIEWGFLNLLLHNQTSLRFVVILNEAVEILRFGLEILLWLQINLVLTWAD